MVSGRTAVRTFGELAMTIGLVLLLFVAWETWGKAGQYQRAQDDLTHQVEQDWHRDPPPPGTAQEDEVPVAGQPMAVLHVPRLGLKLVVVEGVTLSALTKGPGHYPSSQLPGQAGNFAVAGHRSPGIFWDLDDVVEGDVVVVETRSRWFTYRVSEQKIVAPTAIEEIAPVPDRPDAEPDAARITLTTCNPKWDNYQRLVVHGVLSTVLDKANGRPAELGG
ncbi:class E sortase [Lentzea aerocolonigenes]|uniref:class E sortase n=1 Tax=Lentzea aerocolonigenes TaxID=68170 RepID=UPI000B28601A|nr:class E sortase [Lentzea aerocolonigenes]